MGRMRVGLIALGAMIASVAVAQESESERQAIPDGNEHRDDANPWGTGTPASERSDRPFAPAQGLDPSRGVEVEMDLVTANAERERARELDRQRDEAVREARIEAARREAPFDLAWGLDPV